MRNWTIGKKITLYYAAVLIAFTAVFCVAVYFSAVNQIKDTARTTLTSAVDDGFEHIVYDEGIIQIGDDFQTNYRGVAIIVYDETGVRIKGSEPAGFPIYTPLKSGEYHQIETGGENWMIYDTLKVYENGSGIWIRGIYTLDSGFASLGAITITVMLAIPGLMIIAVIAGGLIARKSMRPVAKITEAAAKINNGHDLSLRLPVGKSRDELYRLAETLNAMIDRLETAFKSEAEFTSDVSHELKTPVAVILAECEYALAAADTEEEYKEALSAIQNQCRRMNSLITQLLQVSRTINTGKVIEKHDFSLSDLCESVTGELKAVAEGRGVSLSADVQPDISFNGDETLIMRMLINLLSNGIKYSDPSKAESQVKLRLYSVGSSAAGSGPSSGDGAAIIEVRDNGIGISDADLPHVFDRFYKADKSRTRDSDGSSDSAVADSFGLGLSMVKWIAEAHGGSVRAESRKGEGSVFTVELPIN